MTRSADRLADELSRRDFIQRVGALGAGAFVLAAVPVAERMIAADRALATVMPDDATLQAFADTMVPGRKARWTDMGDEIDPQAIAGVDSQPGAVEADALRAYHDPLLGFESLAGPFQADLNGRALAIGGGPFLTLPFDKRVSTCLSGLDFGNGSRVLWEAAAAVPFAAFCAAIEHPIGTNKHPLGIAKYCSGYRVMGYPGAAPNGYTGFSYGRKLSQERTQKGYLP
ncbi:MAG: twin-arginine translocation signal domain-containing protein [Actinobacteria bacterium]|nr:twin-arginine translocation signal domain-containing protein [Actinomycetota bacterium]